MALKWFLAILRCKTESVTGKWFQMFSWLCCYRFLPHWIFDLHLFCCQVLYQTGFLFWNFSKIQITNAFVLSCIFAKVAVSFFRNTTNISFNLLTIHLSSSGLCAFVFFLCCCNLFKHLNIFDFFWTIKVNGMNKGFWIKALVANKFHAWNTKQKKRKEMWILYDFSSFCFSSSFESKKKHRIYNFTLNLSWAQDLPIGINVLLPDLNCHKVFHETWYIIK